jgi:hypothetical protein
MIVSIRKKVEQKADLSVGDELIDHEALNEELLE